MRTPNVKNHVKLIATGINADMNKEYILKLSYTFPHTKMYFKLMSSSRAYISFYSINDKLFSSDIAILIYVYILWSWKGHYHVSTALFNNTNL